MNMFIKDAPNSGEKKDWEPVKAGSHVAICFAAIDLGMQKNTFAKNEDGRDAFKRELMLAFEITDDKKKLDDGKLVPKVLTKRMAFSVAQSRQGVKSTLRKILEAWLGFTDEKFFDGFDLAEEVIGKPAIITVNHKPRKDGDGIFEEIATISGIVPGLPVPKMESTQISFAFPAVYGGDIIKMTAEERKAVIDAVEQLPTTYKMQSKVKESQTYTLYKNEYPANEGKKLTEVSGEELPF